MASLPRSHELLGAGRGLEGVHVGKFPLRVVGVPRLTHRRAEHAAVPEGRTGHLAAELGVLPVPLGVGSCS